MKISNKVGVLCALLLPLIVQAHGPIPPSLINAPIPPVPGLLDGEDPIIVDKDMAIALGKALFWDMNVGSDGIACGTCHFHAGADRRIKNQRNTGTFSSQETGETFELNAAGGANHTLRNTDFPLHQRENPVDRFSPVVFDSDDVISSSGTFSGEFHSAGPFSGMNDDCERSADPIHNVEGIGVRRVEPRNAPTMINAIFNHRNFWDGRANNIFNGSSNWGDRDPDAGVWVLNNSGGVEKTRLHLINSSLASQAIATLQSDTEMACRDRKLPDLGRKILSQRPLSRQNVHPDDSVLGVMSYSRATGKLKQGLKTSYEEMIRQAFNDKYWSYALRDNFGQPQAEGGEPFNQMEANFALFIGLALQVYESTLVSDQAPIDTVPRDEQFLPVFDDPAANAGMDLFIGNHCNLCHAGVTLSTAAIVTNAMILAEDPDAFGKAPFLPKFAGLSQYPNVIGRTVFSKGRAMHDFGFFNTGVADPKSDPGVDGLDAFGNSISSVAQYRNYLLNNADHGADPGIADVFSCAFEEPLAFNLDAINNNFFTIPDGLQLDPNNDGCIATFSYLPTEEAALANLEEVKMQASTVANFKMPTLRNVELTGPYMHNGGMATLDEVLQFYTRGGNFFNPDIHNIVGTVALGDPTARANLIAFLKTLTDDRVRYERAPFDHPQIKVPHGAVGDENSVTPGNSLGMEFAEEEMLVIPAVGENGREEPLQPFDTFLIQDETELSVSSRIRETEVFQSPKARKSKYNENDEY